MFSNFCFQRGLFKEKLHAVTRKDPLGILRGIKNICTPKKRILEIFFTDTKKGDASLDEMVRQLKDKFTINVLTSDKREYYDRFIAFCIDIPLSKQLVDEYLSNGCRIFLVLDKDEIIGVTTLDFGKHALKGIIELDLIFAKNHAYSFLTYVRLDYRRKGIATLLRFIVQEYCASQGYDGYFSLIDDWNTANLSHHRKRGDRHYGRISVVEQFFIKRYRVKSFNNDRFWQVRLKNGKLIRI